MAARVRVNFGGKEYVSVPFEEFTAKEICDMFYKDFAYADKMRLEVAEGYIIFGKDVVQGSVIIFEDISGGL